MGDVQPALTHAVAVAVLRAKATRLKGLRSIFAGHMNKQVAAMYERAADFLEGLG